MRTNDGNWQAASPSCLATTAPMVGCRTVAVGKYDVCIKKEAR